MNTVTENLTRVAAPAGEKGDAIAKVKKIPPELRVPPMSYKKERSLYRRLLLRLKEDSQFLRSTVQAAFALLTIWIGIDFYLFMQWGMSGGVEAFHARPPGAEGFLPIGAFMSASYFLKTGIVTSIHPAGLFIFAAIVLVSIALKKAFCSWICPIGTLSESLWMLGEKIFGRNLRLWKGIDIPLRGLKYLLLAFFVYAIVQMDAGALAAFLESPYYRMADVKMFLFFAHISTFALSVIGILAALSVVVKNFWCRYLCPYGGLLGLLSLLSPLKITRTAETCIDCELCTKACPAAIPVHKRTRVFSDECTGCLGCTQACPVKDTLAMKAAKKGKEVPSFVFGLLAAGIFVAVTGMAMATGNWQNSMSRQEYLQRMQEVDSARYQHNMGRAPAE